MRDDCLMFIAVRLTSYNKRRVYFINNTDEFGQGLGKWTTKSWKKACVVWLWQPVM